VFVYILTGQVNTDYGAVYLSSPGISNGVYLVLTYWSSQALISSSCYRNY
jgi:hypothetical protein